MQAQLGAILQNLAIFTGFLADLSSGHALILQEAALAVGLTWRVVPNERRGDDGWPQDAAG